MPPKLVDTASQVRDVALELSTHHAGVALLKARVPSTAAVTAIPR
jgi:hypothetical protein